MSAGEINYHGFVIDYDYSPGYAGSTGGPPDSWAPPESAEVDITGIMVDDPAKVIELCDIDPDEVTVPAQGTVITEKQLSAFLDIETLYEAICEREESLEA